MSYHLHSISISSYSYSYSYSYEYDENGNRTYQREVQSGTNYTTVYDYDIEDR